MPQPAHASLPQQCVHAGDYSSLQDFVLPGDVQDSTETAHVGSQGPRFAAKKEDAENAGSVYLDFGLFCQLAVGPHSLCQSGHGRG